MIDGLAKLRLCNFLLYLFTLFLIFDFGVDGISLIDIEHFDEFLDIIGIKTTRLLRPQDGVVEKFYNDSLQRALRIIDGFIIKRKQCSFKAVLELGSENAEVMLKFGVGFSQLSGALSQSHGDVSHVNLFLLFHDIPLPEASGVMYFLEDFVISASRNAFHGVLEEKVPLIRDDCINQFLNLAFKLTDTAIPERIQLILDIVVDFFIRLSVPQQLSEDNSCGRKYLFFYVFEIVERHQKLNQRILGFAKHP